MEIIYYHLKWNQQQKSLERLHIFIEMQSITIIYHVP